MKNKESARARRPVGPAAPEKPAVGAKAALDRLQEENASLLARLVAAEHEIARLRSQRDEALNRIEWVIDSIKTWPKVSVEVTKLKGPHAWGG